MVALAAGLLVWKSSPGGGSSQSADGDIDRTVGVLREKDPVCDEWGKYADELAEKEKRWATLNKGIPAAKWTPEQREIFESVGQDMRTAADQFEAILPNARNVVLQELIAQTVVYLRAYVDRIPNYVGSDALLAGVANNFGGAVTYMCMATQSMPSPGRGDMPVRSAASEPAALTPFIAYGDSRCKELQTLFKRQSSQLGGWISGDATQSALEWNSDERALNDAAREVLDRDQRELSELGEEAGNPIMSDLILTQARYMQAFADVIPTYTPDDARLWTTATYLGGGLSAACQAKL